MDGAEFVSNWKALKAELVEAFTASGSTTATSFKIRELGLSEHQSEQIRDIVDSVITDTMYSLLLGLDGAASIGPDQQIYTIIGEDGKPVESIEQAAWNYFHGPHA